MRAKKLETKEIADGFCINPALTGKYADQPLFTDKVEKANHILKTTKLPNFSKSEK